MEYWKEGEKPASPLPTDAQPAPADPQQCCPTPEKRAKGGEKTPPKRTAILRASLDTQFLAHPPRGKKDYAMGVAGSWKGTEFWGNCGLRRSAY